jgi:hypothetical protein
MVRGFVLLGREPGGVGRTIRCVDRVDCAVPGRFGLRLIKPVRGVDIGCVVAVPADRGGAGIKPLGCGNLTAGKDTVAGGV